MESRRGSQTFPFPEGLSPDTPATDYAEDPRVRVIADVAVRLVELRDRWLNPPEWLVWVEEPVQRFPKRAVARNEAAEKELRKRTLLNVYNAHPQLLDDAHGALDAAVTATYGWSSDITEDDALRELLKMNRATWSAIASRRTTRRSRLGGSNGAKRRSPERQEPTGEIHVESWSYIEFMRSKID